MLNGLDHRDGCLVTERAGDDAPWLVLVHGLSQDHRLFDRQIDAFSPSFRLLLIDLPGHGLSRAVPGPYGLSEFADHIQKVVETNKASGAHFWGTHLGASAGLLLACRQARIFRSLILESPVFPGRVMPSVVKFLPEVTATARQSGLAAARELWWQKGPWFDGMRQSPVQRWAAQHRRIIDDFEGVPWLDAGLVSKPLEPLEDSLEKLSLPVALINGEHDLPDFIEAADALEALIPQVSRFRIADAGGFPLREMPKRVNPVVWTFLADLAARERT